VRISPTVAYDYYVNMDNIHLQAAVKQQPKQTNNPPSWR